MKTFKTTDGHEIVRLSRWIKLKQAYNVTERHALHYYAEDLGNGENALNYFVWDGHKWALNQFYRFGTMFTPEPPPAWHEGGKLQHMAGYNAEDYYNPIMIELSEDCEAVRVYREVRRP